MSIKVCTLILIGQLLWGADREIRSHRHDEVPQSTAINLALDLAGTPDSRPGTWGNAAAYASTVHFDAPLGYRTRILHVYGDFIAFPKDGTVASGTRCEVGFGLKTTAPDGSALVSFPGYEVTPYDNSFLWVQGVITQGNESQRLPFDSDTWVGGLLIPDNIMKVQEFVALNTTGLTIHMEPTLVVVYKFEKEETTK